MGQTDGRYQVHDLPASLSYAVDKEGLVWPFIIGTFLREAAHVTVSMLFDLNNQLNWLDVNLRHHNDQQFIVSLPTFISGICSSLDQNQVQQNVIRPVQSTAF